MYRYVISEEASETIKHLHQRHQPGIKTNIGNLTQNPYKKAKRTNIPTLCEFYINAGNQYCIIFDIDEENKIIYINRVLNQSYLYRLMNPPCH